MTVVENSKNSKFSTVHLLHCQFMFLDYTLDVNCRMSVWALHYSPYQGWKLPQGSHCLTDNADNFQLQGLTE